MKRFGPMRSAGRAWERRQKWHKCSVFGCKTMTKLRPRKVYWDGVHRYWDPDPDHYCRLHAGLICIECGSDVQVRFRGPSEDPRPICWTCHRRAKA